MMNPEYRVAANEVVRTGGAPFRRPWSVGQITSFCDGRHSAQPLNAVILSPGLIASSTMGVSIPNDSVRKSNHLGSGLLPGKITPPLPSRARRIQSPAPPQREMALTRE